MSNPKIHNVRFYKPKPKAVYCMALEPQGRKLAISRSDASIEVWTLSNAPFVERRIASSTENFTIEGLAWCGARLFSVGLHGLLIEYDLLKLDIKSRAVVTGEAAFCLDIEKKKNQIAIGTEQGYLNIFQIAEDEVYFEKFLDKQEGRILCLKYDNTGEYIVSGSLDAIRIWNVNTGQALHKLIPGRSEHHKPTIVWCLEVTEDFTIISGDSRGILTVWDGKVGAQLESYQTHKADILSLCMSDDQNSLYCAGIDPNIVNYVRIKLKDGAHKWVRSIQRKIHDHDVRALVLDGNKLYSSGIDGYLACSYHPPKTLLKYPPLLPPSCVTVARKSRHVLLRYPKHVEIWSLGETGSGKDKNSGFFELKNEPKKLAVLQKVSKTDEEEERKEGITCAAISDDGTLIMYSTRLGIRLLKFVCDEDNPQLIPLEMLDGLGETQCVNAIFTGSNLLITAPNSGGLQVFGLDNETPRLMQNVDLKLTDVVMLLASSSDSKYLVAGDVNSNVVVLVLKNKQYSFYCKLPRYKVSPTALAIHPKIPNLVVAYSDSNIIEYDLKKKELSEFSRVLCKSLPQQWTSRTNAIKNVTFDPRTDHMIILHDDDSIVVIDKKKELSSRGAKQSKTESKDVKKTFFKFIKKYKHLVHLSWLSDDEMVAVEVNPLSLIEQLPPCLVQNTFGRK